MRHTLLGASFAFLALTLSACAADPGASLSRDLAGQNLNGRIAVLRTACLEHARHHANRKDEKTGGYEFVGICEAMGARILEASQGRGVQGTNNSFASLLAQCRAQGDNVRMKRTGPSGKALTSPSQRPAFRRDTEAICNSYQAELDGLNTRNNL